MMQESIFAARTKMENILSFRWDHNITDPGGITYRVIDVQSGDSDLNRTAGIGDRRRRGHVYEDRRRRMLILERNATAIGQEVTGEFNDIDDFETTNEDIIIDSTASLSVNNYLTRKEFEGRLIHTSLYNNGTIAFVGLEGKDRGVKIIDITALMYQKCTEENDIAKRITNTHATYQSIGQGCGSFTTVCSDATISISSAGMSNLIQSKIDNGFNNNGEFILGIMDENNLGMSWETTTIHPLEVQSIQGTQGEDWEIRIFQNVLDEIKIESEKWNNLETGGILIGHISITTQIIVITGQIEAPKDSQRGQSKFYSGVKGLSEKLKSIEKSSAGMITQLGTWHSHPNSSSSPSIIDITSKKKMYEDRNDMPTVCLIWSQSGFTVY